MLRSGSGTWENVMLTKENLIYWIEMCRVPWEHRKRAFYSDQDTGRVILTSREEACEG